MIHGKDQKEESYIVNVGGDAAVDQNGGGAEGEGGMEMVYNMKLEVCR